jgi:hypothetical protein
MNARIDGGFSWIFRIKFDGARDILEVSTHPNHHHVPNRELGCGVSGLKSPFSHAGLNIGVNG